MFNSHSPSQGSLLLSEPFISDPVFERAVIILCEHNENGSIGLILNHKSHLVLSDIFNKVKIDTFPIYLGGPVEEATLFFLHRAYDKLQSGTLIYQDIYWGGDFDYAIELMNEGTITPEDIKFFLGYSGWSAGQLDEELKINSWAVHNQYDIDLTFIKDGEDLWRQSLINLGPKYAHVANFPKSPYLN